VHEYSVVQALMERVLAEARARGATAVHRLSVRIGELSGIEPELLASAYTLVKDNGLCDASELDIRRVPAVWACRDCGQQRGRDLRCPTCRLAKLLSGDEILLERIEMEVPDVRHLRLRRYPPAPVDQDRCWHNDRWRPTTATTSRSAVSWR
jgi:hydrogenase nickel incorporation protein HypA/HybF